MERNENKYTTQYHIVSRKEIINKFWKLKEEEY